MTLVERLFSANREDRELTKYSAMVREAVFHISPSLEFHTDGRFSDADMERLADTIDGFTREMVEAIHVVVHLARQHPDVGIRIGLRGAQDVAALEAAALLEVLLTPEGA